MDDFDDEPTFEHEFQAFVQRGGLDEVHTVSEDFERACLARQQCTHNKPKRACSICSPPPPPKWGPPS